MKIIKSILLLFLLTFLVSCEKSTTEVESEGILNVLWKLEAFETDGAFIPTPIDENYNIEFRSDNSFIGKSDCNNIGGKYKMNVDSLSVIQLSTTKAYCGEDSFYSLFCTAVQQSSSFSLQNNRLMLYYGNNSKLIFKAE